MEIQYHLAPGELLELLEPAYGRGIAGFPLEEIEEAESRLAVRLPPLYRNFLLQYGRCSLNTSRNRLCPPGELRLIYDWYRVRREEDRYDPEDPSWAVGQHFADGRWGQIVSPFGELFRHPEDEWSHLVKDHLLIWMERQGLWTAGIRVEDLNRETIPVFYPDGLYSYQWTQVYPSLEEFLTRMIFESVEDRATRVLKRESDICYFYRLHGMEGQTLCPPLSRPGRCVSFYLPEEHTLGFCVHSRSGDTLSLFDLPEPAERGVS